MRKDIKNQILKLKHSAQQCADAVLAQNPLTYEFFDAKFTEYMCDKFMLSKEELVTDDFYEICQLSADKAAHLPKGMLDAAELASKCGGATTAMNKKVLFFLAVNRDYGLNIQAEESVVVETFTQLKQLVYTKLTQTVGGENESTEG